MSFFFLLENFSSEFHPRLTQVLKHFPVKMTVAHLLILNESSLLEDKETIRAEMEDGLQAQQRREIKIWTFLHSTNCNDFYKVKLKEST